MSKSQNSKKLIAFVDYIPAELKENKTWEIVYYAIDPLETDSFKRLKRKRNRVKPIVNITERRKFAKRIITNLNEKLAKGWTPFLHEKNAKVYTKLFDAFEIFIKQLEQKIVKGALRKDTLRAYNSYIKNIKGFYEAEGKEDCFVTDFNEDHCRRFLDVIFYDRENSARTHNNYLTFIGVFTRWLVKRRYINVDFTSLLSKIKQGEKKRTIIPQQERVGIFNYLEKNNFHYGVLCQTAFYCLIRRTEFTKLKVKDVILSNGIINVPAEASKNRKSQIVTIPLDIINYLATHLSNADNDDFLFSDNNYKPGKEQLTPRKISYTWDKLRKTLKLADTYQWYSLKDTGITNYLQLGIPTIDVKNQARHYSIQQTEEYLPKNIFKAIGNIQSAKLNF